MTETIYKLRGFDAIVFRSKRKDFRAPQMNESLKNGMDVCQMLPNTVTTTMLF